MGLFHFPPAFAVITLGTGCYNVRPFVAAIHVSRNDMVDRHAAVAFTAILTGIIITTKDLSTR
jgi:hypothetical protein